MRIVIPIILATVLFVWLMQPGDDPIYVPPTTEAEVATMAMRVYGAGPRGATSLPAASQPGRLIK